MSSRDQHGKRLAVYLPLAAAETIRDAALKAGNEAGLPRLTFRTATSRRCPKQ